MCIPQTVAAMGVVTTQGGWGHAGRHDDFMHYLPTGTHPIAMLKCRGGQIAKPHSSGDNAT